MNLPKDANILLLSLQSFARNIFLPFCHGKKENPSSSIEMFRLKYIIKVAVICQI